MPFPSFTGKAEPYRTVLRQSRVIRRQLRQKDDMNMRTFVYPLTIIIAAGGNYAWTTSKRSET
jgi:hypothetical protein